MTLGYQGRGHYHGGNGLGWVAPGTYFYVDDLWHLVLITDLVYDLDGQGHSVNELEWVGARHLYLNFDDTRF